MLVVLLSAMMMSDCIDGKCNKPLVTEVLKPAQNFVQHPVQSLVRPVQNLGRIQPVVRKCCPVNNCRKVRCHRNCR